MQRCGAKTRSGQACKTAAMANGRCRMHGGTSLRGIAHPNYQGKGYSRYVPKPFGDVFARAVADPQILDLTPSVATQEAVIADLLLSLEGADGHTAGIIERLQTAEELKRKLVDTEMRRREKMRMMLPMQDVAWHFGALLDSNREAILECGDLSPEAAQKLVRKVADLYVRRVRERTDRSADVEAPTA